MKKRFFIKICDYMMGLLAIILLGADLDMTPLVPYLIAVAVTIIYFIGRGAFADVSEENPSGEGRKEKRI